jgi:hypothetical protein
MLFIGHEICIPFNPKIEQCTPLPTILVNANVPKPKLESVYLISIRHGQTHLLW